MHGCVRVEKEQQIVMPPVARTADIRSVFLRCSTEKTPLRL
jgi:hypothetical protein